MKKTTLIVFILMIIGFMISSCTLEPSKTTSINSIQEITPQPSVTSVKTTSESNLDLEPDTYYLFGEYYGRGDNIYINKKLSEQTGYLDYRDSEKGVGEVSPKLSINILGNDYEIEYVKTRSNLRIGQDWDVYRWCPEGKYEAELYFDSKNQAFCGFFIRDPDKYGYLFNIGDEFQKMSQDDVTNWIEENFSYIVDFSQFNNIEVKYNPDRTLAPYKYEIEWHIQTNGYNTNQWIKTSVLYDGTVVCFRYYKGIAQTNINFNITEEQKEQELQNILEQQLKTESTRYAKSHQKQTSSNEIIVEQDGKLYLLITYINANFNIIDDSHKHKNWYVKTDVLIPLEKYLTN